MQVSKWGNSLAVRLPKALVQDLGLNSGDQIELVPLAPSRLGVRRLSREEALARMQAMAVVFPPDFRFDRDEANSR